MKYTYANVLYILTLILSMMKWIIFKMFWTVYYVDRVKGEGHPQPKFRMFCALSQNNQLCFESFHPKTNCIKNSKMVFKFQ